MRNHCTAIDNDPLTVFFAFNARLGKTGVAHGVAHTGGQRFGLAIGRSRSDDHALKKRSDVLGVEHLDVLRLDIFQPVNNGALQFLDIFFALGAGSFDNDRGHAMLQ